MNITHELMALVLQHAASLHAELARIQQDTARLTQENARLTKQVHAHERENAQGAATPNTNEWQQEHAQQMARAQDQAEPPTWDKSESWTASDYAAIAKRPPL